MDDLAVMERRIMTALHQMERGLEGLTGTAGTDAAVLRDALAAERQMTAQLTERVRAIRDKQDTAVATLEQRLAQAVEQMNRTAQDLERQRQLNAELQATVARLSETARPGESPSTTDEAGLRAELAALRLARAADLAAMDDIIAALEPLIAEAADA